MTFKEKTVKVQKIKNNVKRKKNMRLGEFVLISDQVQGKWSDRIFIIRNEIKKTTYCSSNLPKDDANLLILLRMLFDSLFIVM